MHALTCAGLTHPRPKREISVMPRKSSIEKEEMLEQSGNAIIKNFKGKKGRELLIKRGKKCKEAAAPNINDRHLRQSKKEEKKAEESVGIYVLCSS